VKAWPEPANITELRSFLGFCSYYRRYIENFAEIAKPLHKLTQKDKTFGWSDSCQQVFETLKHKLVSPPILATIYLSYWCQWGINWRCAVTNTRWPWMGDSICRSTSNKRWKEILCYP
jgi:hypothetical protein